mmetsp:Transcript_5617/g.10087  ORF Transcript_5617/g.10087 Transcript_5617/m.10087 type:complete len:190 (+) Transcript_5617:211-780(+)
METAAGNPKTTRTEATGTPASRRAWARAYKLTRSPTNDISSPTSKALVGTFSTFPSKKATAKVLFDNGIRLRQQQTCLKVEAKRASSAALSPKRPLKLKSRKQLFMPYTSPTDKISSPTTKHLKKRRQRKPFVDENTPPVISIPKTKNFARTEDRKNNLAKLGKNVLKPSSRPLSTVHNNSFNCNAPIR